MKKTFNGTILIVDDDEGLLEALKDEVELTQPTCRVLTATGGREAYEIALKEEIDIILSDVRMSKGDGVTLLEKVKKIDPKKPLFLLMTGFSAVSRESVEAKGVDGMLSKPFDIEEVWAFLE